METPCCMVSLGGAQTWKPEINEEMWSSLLHFKRLLFPLIQINFPPNTPNTPNTFQTAKNSQG